MLVRPATVEDLAACARLIASYEGGDPADWQQRFGDHLNDPEGWLSAAVEGRQIIGYGRVQHQVGNPMQADPPLPDGYYLSGIVVAEAHRNRGVGSALCEARIAWVASRADDVWFFTNRKNAASRALHQSVGFREVQEFGSRRLDGGCGVLGHRLTRAG